MSSVSLVSVRLIRPYRAKKSGRQGRSFSLTRLPTHPVGLLDGRQGEGGMGIWRQIDGGPVAGQWAEALCGKNGRRELAFCPRSARMANYRGASGEEMARMELTRKQIDYVAHLSRIELSETERELFGSQLASVLAYVEKLEELDTADVPAMDCVMGLHNVFRDDVERPSAPRGAITANAPSRAHGCYLVPKIID